MNREGAKAAKEQVVLPQRHMLPGGLPHRD
jgi:hypothetical protein